VTPFATGFQIADRLRIALGVGEAAAYPSNAARDPRNGFPARSGPTVAGSSTAVQIRRAIALPVIAWRSTLYGLRRLSPSSVRSASSGRWCGADVRFAGQTPVGQ